MRAHLLLATAIVGTIVGAIPHPAACAMLRPFSQITNGTVHLADLFDALGNTPDRVLGAAPAPGARIVVGSPQLAAIARDFNVDWRPQTGAEQAVVERTGEMLPQARVTDALRQSLRAAGAPDDFDVASPDMQPLMVPPGSTAEPAVTQLSFDQQTLHFSALVGISIPGAPSAQMRVSGQVVAMQQAVIATRKLTHGSVLQAADLRPARVRTGLLRNSPGVVEEDAIGMAVRHDVPAGQVLTAADLNHPSLVERDSLVQMSLDTDGLSLTAQGIAKEAGARGQSIRIENPLSHRIVLAEVTGPGTVRIAPRAAAISLVSAQ